VNTKKMTLSIPEVAETLGISRNLAYELAARGGTARLNPLGAKEGSLLTAGH
jgi:predicted DNA-binding transcriptional regulator AlpA